MIADNFDSELDARGASAAPVLKFYEFHLDLGGPIVQDKAWFYMAYNNFFIDTAVSGQPIETGTDIGDFDIFTTKLNYQITERDQFIGFSTWSWKRKPNRSISSTIPARIGARPGLLDLAPTRPNGSASGATGSTATS